MHDQSSDPKESTMEKVSDDSFFLMEKLCDQTMAKLHDESLGDEEDLLDGVEIPNFNDTLEEVEFILEMGEKLQAKSENKVNCAKASSENATPFFCLNDTPNSQPPLKRLKLSSGPALRAPAPALHASTPNAFQPVTSMLSFMAPMSEFSSCRSMINQVCLISLLTFLVTSAIPSSELSEPNDSNSPGKVLRCRQSIVQPFVCNNK